MSLRAKWVLAILVVSGLGFLGYTCWKSRPKFVPLSDVVRDVQAGRVESITVRETRGDLTFRKERGTTAVPVRFTIPEGTNFYELLLQAGVRPERMPRFDVKRSWLPKLVWPAIALTAILVFLYVVLKRGKAIGQQEQHMSEMSARGWTWLIPRYRLDDLAGLHAEVSAQLKEILDMLRHPEVYVKAGVVLPRGVLLSGPPGVGKTMIAHAIAQELRLKELCIVSGPALIGPYIGMASIRLNKLFKEARKKQPCLVFFDEFEIAGAQRRQQRLSGVDSESHQLVVQLLSELEALTDRDRVILIAATNRLDMLDPALLRMGRFDRQIEIDVPGPEERDAILRVHTRDPKVLAPDVRIADIAHGTGTAEPIVTTSGYSGADLAALANEAAIASTFERSGKIELRHFAAANRRVRNAMTRRSVNENEEGTARTLAQMYAGERRVTFAGVGGQARAKQELQIVVDYLRDPKKFEEADCRIPKGILLTGPPGIGKTLLARAVAGEAQRPFFYTSGAEFVQLWVGLAAARVRDLFRIARRQSPCVVFIDELDALAGRRGTRETSGGDEYSHALNQLLTELDGFRDGGSVVVIAATNRVDVLDEAILRPGRMDSIVEMTLPDIAERDEILKLYLRGGLPDDQRLRLARMTQGKSGADLEMLVNSARILSVRNGRRGLLEWTDVAEANTQRRRQGERRIRHP